MKKSELRQKYLTIRSNVKDRGLKDKEILNQLLNIKELVNSDLILSYVSFNEEVDTVNFIKQVLPFKKVAVPRIEDSKMNFYIISSLDELKKGYFNILEPITTTKVENFNNSCCIVPGICFNKEGYRIGYGKGYYDQFLNDYPGYTIGLCYSDCLIDDNFQDSYDVKVKKIIFK